MAYYLLTIEVSMGDWQEFMTHTIEAQDRQMVKYHFHHTLKDWGFKDTQFGKHVLENWDAGILKEIYEIKELDRHEFEIIDDNIYSWHKTADH